MLESKVVVVVVQQRLKRPFVLEPRLDNVQLTNQQRAGVAQRFLGQVVVLGLDPQLKVGEQRVGNLVGSKDHLVVLEKLGPQQVGESVVFSLDLDDGGIWDLGVRGDFDSNQLVMLWEPW